jgi:hypothetical protein
LTNVAASNLNCANCVGNSQLGINYAGSLTQGGAANNALLLNGMLQAPSSPQVPTPRRGPTRSSATRPSAAISHS